ncbi:MAG: amino acid ABC transporter substrate-binding protein [bacterium]|nr:amino acid ABC transporter substrate-binding protein [bacterium]
MKKIFITLIFLFVVNISYSESLKFGYTIWKPYSFMENGKLTGLSIEIYTEALERSGLEYEFIEYPWARAVTYFEVRKIDGLVDGSSDIEHSNTVKKMPILWVQVFWVNNNNSIKNYTGFDQFDGKTVGFIREYEYSEDFINYTDFTKRDLDSDISALQMLNVNRLDAFLGDAVNNFTLAEENNLNIRALDPALALTELSLIFQDNLTSELARFERKLNEMYSDGTIDRIYMKYLNMSYNNFKKKYE